ncbi:putative HAD superfamily hydrolase [Paenibacillus castaneae]|uniref:HAD family hydrolase n=1 Tax=Paenibacillus castaneae TaxID=474957 RepID=UPI000C99F82C|nr:HAD family hydrolase [Paenibacillus castaneae]NIK78354.1 putative HAD superfamily hydrolase [Paenibacillus castaneae]
MKEAIKRISNIKSLKYVFFDIFDTILLRKVHPEYTKMIWAKRISIQLASRITAQEIYNIRNRVEAETCTSNERAGKDKEFTYDQLIGHLFMVFKQENILAPEVDYQSFYDLCLDIEIDVETAVQYVDPVWLETIKEIKLKTELKVICVSDFYLPEEAIRRLFIYHEIEEYIDDFVVSSEYLLTKRTGRLFDFVMESKDIRPSEIIMIGDNEVSDHQIPQSKSIHSHLINRTKQVAFYDRFMKENKFQNNKQISDNVLALAKDNRFKSPFNNIIFSLFYFTKKLYEDLVSKGVKDVFFLSREGEYLKVLFDRYQEAEGYRDSRLIQSHYLKVSRKSTFLPSLKELTQEDFYNLFRQYRKISSYEFMSSLNFEEEFINSLALNLQINLNKKEEDFPTSEPFRILLENKAFQDYYENVRTQQKKLFKLYVSNLSGKKNMESLHIVDVGWKGTIQDNIYNIYDGQVSINGYYVGLVALGNMKEDNDKKGIVFSIVSHKNNQTAVFNENRALFEIMLGATHGSADRYIYKDNNTDVGVLTIQNEKEKEIFEKIVQPAQNGMFETFEEICEIFCLRSLDIENFINEFALIHSDLVLSPTTKELSFFDKLYHYENFGVFEFTEFNAVLEKRTIVYRINNAFQLIRNPHGFFSNSFWAPITLKEKGLGVLIPLYSWYKKRKYFNKTEEFQNKSDDSTSVINNFESMIKDRDEAIRNMTRMIDDRDDAIKSMTNMIDERDALIKQLYSEIDKLKTHI